MGHTRGPAFRGIEIDAELFRKRVSDAGTSFREIARNIGITDRGLRYHMHMGRMPLDLALLICRELGLPIPAVFGPKASEGLELLIPYIL